MAPTLAGRHHSQPRLIHKQGGAITNSNLELAALILHEATLIAEVPDASLAAPRSGSDNTPTASWSTKEASTINPVLADLLRIRALHSSQFFIPFCILSPGHQNCMADGASRLFDLSDTSLPAHMSASYPQLKSLWKLSLPTPDLLSCVISTLRRNPCEQEPHKMHFHRKIADWRILAEKTADRPTHLTEIVRNEPTYLGFCDNSGLGTGGVWLYPAG